GARADFLRAAVLGWTTPLVTALSSVRIASATAVRSASPPAARAVLTAVRTWERMVRLRTRRFSLVRMRFMADLVFATQSFLLSIISPRASAVERPAARTARPTVGESTVAVRADSVPNLAAVRRRLQGDRDARRRAAGRRRARLHRLRHPREPGAGLRARRGR